ncbi:unnamed protein product, partial [Ectocarpus sp. 12 AP-2014]
RQERQDAVPQAWSAGAGGAGPSRHGGLSLGTGPERRRIIFERPCGQVPCKGRGTELLLTRPGARLRE